MTREQRRAAFALRKVYKGLGKRYSSQHMILEQASRSLAEALRASLQEFFGLACPRETTDFFD